MTETDEVSQMYGEVYIDIKLYKRYLKKNDTKRKPVRIYSREKNEYFQLPVEMRKKAISINSEKWLWDVVGKIEPNRSFFFKNLVLKKLKCELLNAGLVNEETLIGKEHIEIYVKELYKKAI